MILVIIIIIIALPAILMHLLLRKNKKNSSCKNNLPPGPRGLPLIGNLHQLAGATFPHIYLSHLSKIHGPLLRLNLGSTAVVVVSSAKLAKQVLKDQDLTFCSRPKLVAQQKLSYNASDMVFSPYNAHWREVRRIAAAHLLSPTKVQSFRPVREDEVARMVAKIASSPHPVVDLSAAAMGLTTTLICRIGFGRRYEEQGAERRRFEELLRELRQLTTTFFVSDYFPALSWVDKASGLMKRIDCAFEKLDSFYQELIDDHLRRRRHGGVAGTEEEDHDDILRTNIFLGGTDSSAASIVWNMTALMKAPAMMKKVQEEIRNVVGNKGKVDDDDLPKLPYLKAIINETFRLYSPVPMLAPRETTAKCNLNGYEIPPKTTVYVNVWAIARDPEYWTFSPEEFLPERFMGSDIDMIDVKGQDFGAIPFGSGRRICPGMFMGLANVELAVANLLYSFDWEMPPGIGIDQLDTDALPGLIMHKKNPLLLQPKLYNFRSKN
ncbi:hypothetical protein C2S53_010005 [Perilla frutescens var. hirtella]|uniref:Cytochrome P450 n=1 Tax=Perilla frutescens var. hirtella TaxID=608512 RepID=A0AAD4NX59_PERFH|nr:hypothetical protein C2S53_010005 [Perilla frutescens var. hirtella]